MSIESRLPNDQDPQGLIEAAARPGGVIHEIASALIEPGVQLEAPGDVWEVILPQKGVTEVPRWQLLEEAPATMKALAAERKDRIFYLADQTRLRLPESLPPEVIEELARAYPSTLVAAVEGGARETAAKRGCLLDRALDLATVPLDVPIFYIATDDYKVEVMKKGVPNPEQAQARAIADGLPEGDLTQFQITNGAIRRLRYAATEKLSVPGIGTFVEYDKPGERKRIVVRPEIEGEKGTVAGLLAIHKVYHRLDIAKPVVASNGQYRQKLGLQVLLVAAKAGITLEESPLVLGDEAGFVALHPDPAGNMVSYKTPPRDELVYLKEFAVAGKLQAKLDAARTT